MPRSFAIAAARRGLHVLLEKPVASDLAQARAVADATQKAGLLSVAGGGDTVSALRHAGVLDKLTYVSSAGGAFLEWMEGKTLPGVAALEG